MEGRRRLHPVAALKSFISLTFCYSGVPFCKSGIRVVPESGIHTAWPRVLISFSSYRLNLDIAPCDGRMDWCRQLNSGGRSATTRRALSLFPTTAALLSGRP